MSVRTQVNNEAIKSPVELKFLDLREGNIYRVIKSWNPNFKGTTVFRIKNHLVCLDNKRQDSYDKTNALCLLYPRGENYASLTFEKAEVGYSITLTQKD